MKAALQDAILSMKNGDQKGLEFLFNTYHKKIYYFGIKLGLDNAISEEIVQDVFVKIWSIRHSIDQDGSVQALIYTIAKNIIFDTYKENVKRKAAEDYQFHLLQPVNQTENVVEFNELQEIVRNTLASLPEKRRLVFEFSKFHGLKNREIAAELGISIKTVETHLSLAMQSFKSAMKNSEAVNLSVICLIGLQL